MVYYIIVHMKPYLFWYAFRGCLYPQLHFSAHWCSWVSFFLILKVPSLHWITCVGPKCPNWCKNIFGVPNCAAVFLETSNIPQNSLVFLCFSWCHDQSLIIVHQSWVHNNNCEHIFLLLRNQWLLWMCPTCPDVLLVTLKYLCGLSTKL